MIFEKKIKLDLPNALDFRQNRTFSRKIPKIQFSRLIIVFILFLIDRKLIYGHSLKF